MKRLHIRWTLFKGQQVKLSSLQIQLIKENKKTENLFSLYGKILYRNKLLHINISTFILQFPVQLSIPVYVFSERPLLFSM